MQSLARIAQLQVWPRFLLANNWGAWESVYFINSTVLGRVITETTTAPESTQTGRKRYTYVVAGAATIARQELSATNAEGVAWQFNDAAGLSGFGYDMAERDGLGNNVGKLPFTGSSRTENSMTAGQSLTFNNMGMADCQYNGTLMPCSMAHFFSGDGSPFFSTDHGGLPIQAGRLSSAKNNPAYIANDILRGFAEFERFSVIDPRDLTSDGMPWWVREFGSSSRVLYENSYMNFLLGGGEGITQQQQEAIDLAAAALELDACKSLFSLDGLSPSDLLKGPNVNISFADLSKVKNSYGKAGGLLGTSSGHSGTVVALAPDGTEQPFETRTAKKNGLQIVRNAQGPQGSMRIHSRISNVQEMAYVIIHELGHIAVGMYGESASKIIDDAGITEKDSRQFHNVNRKVMEKCKKAIKRIAKTRS